MAHDCIRTLSVLSAVTLAALASTLATEAHAWRWVDRAHMKDTATLFTTLTNLDLYDREIDAWAVEPDGDWIIVSGTDVYHSTDMDNTFVTGVKWNVVFGRTIHAMDCRADGLCVAVHDAGVYSNGTAPSSLVSTANTWTSVNGWTVRDVELTSGGGWLLLGPGSAASYSGLPTALGEAVFDRRASGRQITDVAIDHDNSWMLIADGNPMWDGVHDDVIDALQSRAFFGHQVDSIQLGPSGDYILYNGQDDYRAYDTSDPTEVIEYELGAGSTNLWRRMQELGVSGVAVAVVDDNEVVSARGYGVLRDGEDRPVLAKSPWDVASLSKYVGALASLRTLEGFRAVDLDDDAIATAGSGGTVENWVYLHDNFKGLWGYPSGILDVPSGGITYRELLSHTGGLVSHGSTPIPVSAQDTVGDQSPLAFLSGYVCDDTLSCSYSTSRAAYYDGSAWGPGRDWDYSNSGIYVAQASLEDLTGKAGYELIEDELVTPMGLDDTTGEYPLPSSFLDRRVNHHDGSGPRTFETVYPWTFAGGVTISVADYAELVILGTNDGVASDGTRILASASMDELLTRVSYVNEVSDWKNYGLGVSLRGLGADGYAGNDNGVFWHNGVHNLRVRTHMCGNPTRGEGLVIFINTEDDLSADEGGVVQLVDEIREAYSDAAGWPTDC